MSKSYFHPCPACGSNLDPGEVCDCERTPVKRINETYIFCADISAGTDISCVTLGRRTGDSIDIVRTMIGKEAEEWYANAMGIQI